MKNKESRPYNSLVRQKQAEETKNRVADAAEELIKSGAYENTTIGAIAKKAGVATQTVYAIFNSKQGILTYLLKRSFLQTRLDLDFNAPIKENSLAKVAKAIAGVTARCGQKQVSSFNALGGFKLLYPELHDLVTEAAGQRRKSIAEAAKTAVEDRGVILSETQLSTIIDVLWAITDNHLYYLLVVEAGWEVERFEALLSKITEAVMRDVGPEMLKAFGDE